MKTGRIVTSCAIGVAVALLLGAPRTAFLQGAVKIPWTAVGSTGTADPKSAPVIVTGESGLTYGSNALTPIIVRYNVVNTAETGPDPSMPPWKRLELGASAPPGSTVRARLLQVQPCSGAVQLIGDVTISGSTGPVCAMKPLTAAVDFHQFLYHVRVDLTRTTPNVKPIIRTLRIHP